MRSTVDQSGSDRRLASGQENGLGGGEPRPVRLRGRPGPVLRTWSDAAPSSGDGVPTPRINRAARFSKSSVIPGRGEPAAVAGLTGRSFRRRAGRGARSDSSAGSAGPLPRPARRRSRFGRSAPSDGASFDSRPFGALWLSIAAGGGMSASAARTPSSSARVSMAGDLAGGREARPASGEMNNREGRVEVGVEPRSRGGSVARSTLCTTVTRKPISLATREFAADVGFEFHVQAGASERC